MSSMKLHQISVDCFKCEVPVTDIGMMDLAFSLMGVEGPRRLINRNFREETMAVVYTNGFDTMSAHTDVDNNLMVTVIGNKYADAYSVQKIVEDSFQPNRIRVSHITRDMAEPNQPE